MNQSDDLGAGATRVADGEDITPSYLHFLSTSKLSPDACRDTIAPFMDVCVKQHTDALAGSGIDYGN